VTRTAALVLEEAGEIPEDPPPPPAEGEPTAAVKAETVGVAVQVLPQSFSLPGPVQSAVLKYWSCSLPATHMFLNDL
jgi:hypothetical protein